MSEGASADPGEPATGRATSDARALTDVVTRLRRALRASIRTDYPWESLPMAQVELLQTLAERAPMRVGELAALLRLAPNTVSGLVSQLIEATLVAREGDPTDRRVARLSLTDAGRQQLAAWQEAHERRIGAALDRLGAAERTAVRQALPALGHLVEHLSDTPDTDQRGR
jgi:DNA-binding MarR family transcriptional regulator